MNVIYIGLANKSSPSRSKKTIREKMQSVFHKMMYACYTIPEKKIKIQYTTQGKPSLVNHPSIFFSQSHSDIYGICAIGRVPLGIDIEVKNKKRNWKDIAAHFFQKKEISFLESQKENAADTFYYLWTRKESWIKLNGLSIWQLQKVPSCLYDSSKNIFFSWKGRGEYPFSLSLCLPKQKTPYSIVFLEDFFPDSISLQKVILSKKDYPP